MGEDVLWHAAAGDDGSFVLCGWTNWPSGNVDFYAVKLDEYGIEVGRWQVIGVRDTDFLQAASFTPPLIASPSSSPIPVLLPFPSASTG